MMPNNLFTEIREDTCIFCGKDRALELYDRNNNPVRFSYLLDNHNTKALDFREIHYGKCKVCGKEFQLDWDTDNRIPIPLTDSKIKKYIQQYSKSKIV